MPPPTPSLVRRALCRALPLAAALPWRVASARGPLRIYHVMSFDSPWRWTDGQFAGFKEGLGAAPAEYRVFQMDVKRFSTPQAKTDRAAVAWRDIQAWQPDLIYTSDDDALGYIGRLRDDASPPLVFSGANRSLTDHGLERASNLTGVLEEEHFAESVQLLRTLSGQVRRLAVISDAAPHWAPVIQRIRARAAAMPGIELAQVDLTSRYAEFQSRVKHYGQGHADAVVYLGIFNLKDDSGRNVPYKTVQRWVTENSALPDISFWIDRIHHGVLCSVTISEHEQGLAAGRLARAILIDGRRAADLPILPTVKGHPAISLARARQLGITVKATELLSSEIVTEFEWNKAAG